MHFLCVLILILTLVGSFRAAPALALLAAFTVNTSTDAHDSNLGDGTCYNGVDGCSLRAAIEQGDSVSSAGDPLTILFWSGIAGTLTLNLGPIDWTANYVTLDGEANGITISGSGLSAGQSIFTISGSHNTINHLTIRNAPLDGVQMGDFAGVGEGSYNTVSYSAIIASGVAGVYVHGGSSGGGQANAVVSSFIGMTESELHATGCVSGYGNGGSGVYVDVNAQNTRIEANYIVCSSNNGVHIDGRGGAPNGTFLRNNVIGRGLTGAMPNTGQGILDEQGMNTNITGNNISGNAAAGIWLYGSSGATLTKNYIGTNSIGSVAIPNGADGVAITDGATNNMVGSSTSVTQRNLISGNTDCGVRIRDGANNNTVDNNLIGLDRDNYAAIPNGAAGVCIFNANNNSIGTSMGGVHQYISGNTREGIYIENSSDNFIGQTNRIGVAADGTTARGNGMEGVMLSGASNTYVVPEILSYNGGAGVAVVGDTAINNLIYSIHTRSNGGLPIDLGNDGATLNGSHSTTGPNHWLGYPVITSASGNPVKIIGTTCANCVVLVYHAVGNPAANGSGGDFLSETTANGSGIWSAILPAGLTRNDVTLVAQHLLTGFTGDTSEMSSVNNYRIYLPLVRR